MQCPTQKKSKFVAQKLQQNNMELLIGLTVPLTGTILGAATVFLVRDRLSNIANKAMLGFASGVMVAACFWSLLQPALEQTGDGTLKETWPVIAGFVAGMLFLLALDTFIPHQHIEDSEAEGPRSALPRSTKMMLAVALHNIPEGMAVGVVFAGLADGSSALSFAGALALSIGMAVQNIPEGAIISMPLKSNGMSRGRAFAYGAMSGAVEPLGAIATIALARVLVPVLPYLLAFSAGAMLYVVVEELIPEMSEGEHSNIGTIFFAIGFTLMMVLDVALG